MKPVVFAKSREMASFSAEARRAGRSIGFVPTMGALHEGHLSLMRRARADNAVVVASIFVNPTQFGPSEDLSKYPRTFQQDLDGCERALVDAVFAPDAKEMYPDGFDTFVVQERLPAVMCGASRPGHFRGVLTICCKLFNVVAPDVVYLGQKDYQQAQIIKRMVADLQMPLRIEVCPTIRERDGLAMSTRNRYLSASERADAACLYRALNLAGQMAAQGADDPGKLIEAMRNVIAQVPSAVIDYVVIADPETLQPLDRVGTRALAALAVKFGGTRLIDNIPIP